MTDRIDEMVAEVADANRFAGLFTLEELVALTTGLDLPPPWFVRPLLPSEAHDGAVDALARLGRSSLVVRGLVRRSGDSFATSSELQVLARVLAEPLLAVGVARVMNDRVHIWSFVARPEAAVGHALSDIGVHRLSMFPTTDLMPAVVEVSGLRRSESSSAHGVEIDADLMREMIERDDTGSAARSDTLEELMAAGFDAGSAALVARLTDKSESGSVVTVLRPDSDHSVVGAVTAWVDAGDEGLWSVDDENAQLSEAPTMRLGPTSGDTILASIVEGLPSAG